MSSTRDGSGSTTPALDTPEKSPLGGAGAASTSFASKDHCRLDMSTAAGGIVVHRMVALVWIQARFHSANTCINKITLKLLGHDDNYGNPTRTEFVFKSNFALGVVWRHCTIEAIECISCARKCTQQIILLADYNTYVYFRILILRKYSGWI